jgi:hypothetical protein
VEFSSDAVIQPSCGVLRNLAGNRGGERPGEIELRRGTFAMSVINLRSGF